LPDVISGTESEDLLRSYFRKQGILLCNENRELPSLVSVGGDWNGIVSLMEQGEVFYSKLYKGRVTYLSRAFYAQIKPYKQPIEKVSPVAKRIFEFLCEAGHADTAEIKNALKLFGKPLSESMDELFRELLVTVIKRSRTLNANWCSFDWGTYKTWEQIHPVSDISPKRESLTALASSFLSERQIRNLLK
jgi:hypothetical protein